MREKTKTGAALARLSAWLLSAIIALAPLPFGSFEPVSVAFWCVALGICAIVASPQPLNRGQLILVALFSVVVAAYAVVLHEQLAQHAWLGPPDPVWQEAEKALGEPLQPAVAVAHNQPLFDLGRPLVCLLAIACGFLVGTDQHYARRCLKVVAWSGAAYAVYGILAHLFDPTHILWRDKEFYLPYVTATFINRNTAAAYFGSCAVIWSLFLWERVRLQLPRGVIVWRKIYRQLSSNIPKKVVLYFAMLFVTLAALFMTGSRGAVVLSLLALIVAFTLYFRRDLSPRTGFATALVGGGTAALILLQVMGAGINARFDIQGAADEGRLETYKSTLHMIADHPWFGTGQGTFAYAFPAYRSSNISLWGIWDIAHNSLLEIASDMGIPLAVLVVAGWIVIFAVLIYGVRTRRKGVMIPVAAFSISLLAVLHSLIDFSLQIPGYSIVVLSLTGVGLAQSLVSGSHIEGKIA